jgi:hypothetical protein
VLVTMRLPMAQLLQFGTRSRWSAGPFTLVGRARSCTGRRAPAFAGAAERLLTLVQSNEDGQGRATLLRPSGPEDVDGTRSTLQLDFTLPMATEG